MLNTFESLNLQRSHNIMVFISALNNAVCDKKISDSLNCLEKSTTNGSNSQLSGITRLHSMLEKLFALTEKHDPAEFSGCRFGNKAFSNWLEEIEVISDQLLEDAGIVELCESGGVLLSNIKGHFLNSFGNGIRRDYGTGHELHFMYFLNGLYSLHMFKDEELPELVLLLINRYFELVRKLVERYNLEPAGSKGAWGIDHYQFLPFLFGSSQLISNSELLPCNTLNIDFVEKHKGEYVYMRAMEYMIRMTKDVPLEIACPMLHSIVTTCTWSKINSGLLKMYKNDVVDRLGAKAF